MNLEDVLLRGTRASQPLATAVAEGQLYSVTDEGYKVEQSRAGAWVPYAGSGSSTSVGQSASFPFTSESDEYIEPVIIFPTQNQIRQILAGTNVTFDDTVPGFRTINAAAGSGAEWTLIESRTPVVGNLEDFVTGLDYNEIMILIVGLIPSATDTFMCRISIDGGASFLVTSGDYKSIDANGVEADVTRMFFNPNTSVNARTAWMTIMNFNGTTKPKLVTNFITANAALIYRIPTTSPLNGIRIFPLSNNFTAVGTISIFGR